MSTSDETGSTGSEESRVTELETLVRTTAETIAAEQPGVEQPRSLDGMDSFSLVQLVLELENQRGTELLESMEHFDGSTFRDLAEHIRRVETSVDTASGASAEQ